MALPTAEEQLTLELINRARIDPQGEYGRLVTNAPANVTQAISFFNVDLVVLKQQFDALTAVSPLAWNEMLGTAADNHSQAMITADQQSHQVPGELDLGGRLTDAGYSFRTAGENVFAFAQDPFHAHAGFFIDWGSTPTGIQAGAGHRVNIMSDRFAEAGVSYIPETAPATSVGPFVVTHNFANRSDYAPQLIGVVIADRDGDDFYDVGEGLGGVTIQAKGTAGTFTTTSWDAGGYQIALPSGTYDVTYTQTGGATQTRTVAIGTSNVKVDADLGAVTGPVVDTGPNDGLFDVYRFFNVDTGAHFYTASEAERDGLISTNASFRFEGNAFDSNANSSTGVAVTRFYNSETGVHFYTASESERASVAASLPQFVEEGTVYFAYLDGGAGRQGLHRFYNTETGTHFYTASDGEQQQVAATMPQFQYEGIGYYVDIA